MRYIITALGCKVNQYEAQAVETLLQEHGLQPAKDGEPVDLIIVNTCAVTAEGGRKSRQTIRRLQQQHPNALTAVCGCWWASIPRTSWRKGNVIWSARFMRCGCCAWMWRRPRERPAGNRAGTGAGA